MRRTILVVAEMPLGIGIAEGTIDGRLGHCRVSRKLHAGTEVTGEYRSVESAGL